MNEIQNLKQSIKNIEEWISKEFSNIRTGRATPSILDSVKVESYGSFMKIQEVATIASEDPRTLRIAPWDSQNIKAVEKAIISSGLGLSVSVDDKGLRVSFPPLTTESRSQFVKVAKQKLEEAKVRVRQERGKVIDVLEKKKKEGTLREDDLIRQKNEVEKIVKEGNDIFEKHYQKKEAEILG
ncbi:MAG: ribosome-recycling factor [bacterium]